MPIHTPKRATINEGMVYQARAVRPHRGGWPLRRLHLPLLDSDLAQQAIGAQAIRVLQFEPKLIGASHDSKGPFALASLARNGDWLFRGIDEERQLVTRGAEHECVAQWVKLQDAAGILEEETPSRMGSQLGLCVGRRKHSCRGHTCDRARRRRRTRGRTHGPRTRRESQERDNPAQAQSFRLKMKCVLPLK
jgi:hypothetical protein